MGDVSWGGGRDAGRRGSLFRQWKRVRQVKLNNWAGSGVSVVVPLVLVVVSLVLVVVSLVLEMRRAG
jgi:hypothetical protein